MLDTDDPEAALKNVMTSERPHISRSEWVPVRSQSPNKAFVRLDDIVEVRIVEAAEDAT